MIFGSKSQRPRGWIVLTGALGALVLGITTASAAVPGDKFHIKATNSTDESFWGVFPKLPEPGAEPEVPGETPTPEPTPEPTPDPTPEPTPEPTLPPVPEPDSMIFTIDLSAPSCLSAARNISVYGTKTSDVKLTSPTGKEVVFPKAADPSKFSTTATNESGRWTLDGEYDKVAFSGNLCLTEVNQWQGAYVKNAYVTFQNTKNLRIIEDVPTQITDMRSMLAGSGFNGDVSGWKTSKVTDMTGMFAGASNFEGKGIENFDMGNVINAGTMFQNATAFNGDVSDWNVEKLRAANGMFTGASSFEGKGMETWETKSLAVMTSMFSSTAKFDGDLGSWDVSKVTDFTNTFSGAKAYRGVGIERWDVSSVTTMNSMFKGASSFNGEIGAWGDKVAKNRNMFTMLQNASKFNQDLSGWMLCKGVQTPSWADGTPIQRDTAKHPDFNRVCTA